MTTAPRPSREIDGKGRTVRELLASRKYSIDSIDEIGLRFGAQVLFEQLAERIWSPERLAQEAAS